MEARKQEEKKEKDKEKIILVARETNREKKNERTNQRGKKRQKKSIETCAKGLTVLFVFAPDQFWLALTVSRWRQSAGVGGAGGELGYLVWRFCR